MYSTLILRVCHALCNDSRAGSARWVAGPQSEKNDCWAYSALESKPSNNLTQAHSSSISWRLSNVFHGPSRHPLFHEWKYPHPVLKKSLNVHCNRGEIETDILELFCTVEHQICWWPPNWHVEDKLQWMLTWQMARLVLLLDHPKQLLVFCWWSLLNDGISIPNDIPSKLQLNGILTQIDRMTPISSQWPPRSAIRSVSGFWGLYSLESLWAWKSACVARLIMWARQLHIHIYVSTMSNGMVHKPSPNTSLSCIPGFVHCLLNLFHEFGYHCVHIGGIITCNVSNLWR